MVNSKELADKFVTFEKLDSMKDVFASSFTEINNQMSEFETNRKQFMFDVATMRNTLADYVNNTQLQKEIHILTEKLERYAPWDAVRGFYKEMEGYTRLGDMQTFQAKTAERFG